MSSLAALRLSLPRRGVLLLAWAVLGPCSGSTIASAHVLGDLVFCDVNGDGVFEPPVESGIAGVTVVRDCGGTVATTVTNTAGRYVFSRTPPTSCRVSVDTSSPPVAGLSLSTPRVGGPPLPAAEHSPFPGFGCGSCPNAFVTTVVADGVFQTTVNNPCNCPDPACPPAGPDPCAGPPPFVGYYGDDFGFVCTSSTTSSTSTSSSSTSSTTTSSTTTTICPPFPFLFRTEGKLGNGGQVTGSIGANDPGGDFHFGKKVLQSDGSTVAADHVGLGEGTSVADVRANTLRIGRGAIVRGNIGTPALPLTAPFCPIPEFTCGSADVTVAMGESVGPLPPGSYGGLTVLRGGTLSLAPGTFEFCSVKTGRGTITVTGSELTTINVVGTFRLGNGSTLIPGSGTPTPRINVAGSLVRVSHASVLEAHLAAPNALLTLGRGARVSGSFCVDMSRSDKEVQLLCPPASPGGAFVAATVDGLACP
jgi:hypothetical protein